MSVNLNRDDGDGELHAAINTTPLVDVMLVLLIVFLITVPVAVRTVPVQLPTEMAVVNRIRPRTMTVAVTRDGALFWNDRPLDGMPALERLLAEAASDSPKPDIDIRGDGDVPFGEVRKVIGAVRRAGLESVALVTEPVHATGNTR